MFISKVYSFAIFIGLHHTDKHMYVDLLRYLEHGRMFKAHGCQGSKTSGSALSLNLYFVLVLKF